MKQLLFALSLLLLTSCGERGETSLVMNGEEEGLPAELKDMKIYRVNLGTGNFIYVCMLNGVPISAKNTSNKSPQAVVLNEASGTYQIGDIIWETDSMMMCRKRL